MTTLTTRLRQAGLELLGPLGAGADGARWAVRDADGRRWAVTVLADPAPAERSHLQERVARLSRVDHPHLAGVGPLVDLAAGGLVVLHEEIPGTDLATVAAARGTWSPGEVVTVVVPLAQALAALHDAGLAHGDVAPGNVVLRPDGRPVLVDVVCADGPGERGTPGMAAPERSSGADAAGDVHALARVGLRLLAGPVEGEDPPGRTRLLDCLATAAALDPAQRPSAGELARLVYDVCPPEAVEMPDAAVLARLALRRLAAPDAEQRTVRTTRGRHRRPRRAHRPLLVAAAAVVLGACVATATIAGNQRAGGSAVAPAGDVPVIAGWSVPLSGDDPVVAAVRLTAARGQALAYGDIAALSAVTVPGSPAALADRRMLGWVVPRPGPVAVRVEHVARQAPGVGRYPGCAGDVGCAQVLLVAQVGRPGTPEADSSPVLLVLRRVPPGWRVSEVLAVPG